MELVCKRFDARLQELGFKMSAQHEFMEDNFEESVTYERNSGKEVFEYYVSDNPHEGPVCAGMCYSKNFDIDPHVSIERTDFHLVNEAQQWMIDNVEDLMAEKIGYVDGWTERGNAERVPGWNG